MDGIKYFNDPNMQNEVDFKTMPADLNKEEYFSALLVEKAK